MSTRSLTRILLSKHVTTLAEIYFPGWVTRSKAAFDILDRDRKEPVERRFGIFFNFCMNAPRLLWDADDNVFGDLPRSKPFKSTRKAAKNAKSDRKPWQKEVKAAFEKITTILLASQVNNMVKALPHVDAKNPAAGICVLFIMGERSSCSTGLPPLIPLLQAHSCLLDDVGSSCGSLA